MKTPTLNCSIADAKKRRLPPGFVLIVQGDRVKAGDLVCPAGKWKPVAASMVGMKYEGGAPVVRPLPTKEQEAEEARAAIQERINKMELRRTLVRSEIDNPPERASVYYFTERLDEVRVLSHMIDAVRSLA